MERLLIMRLITIKNIIIPTLLLGIFFIPFNSWSGIGFLGEYYRDSCFLFFSFAFVLVLFKRRINIPLKNLIFQFLILFILWSILATLFNAHNMADYYFKQTSGLSRFINQFGSLIIASIIIPLTFYNGFKWININKTFRLIRRVVLASLIIVLIYSIIEILIVKFNMVNLKKPLLNLFDYFPFTEAKTDMRLRRISSVTFEPPALGTYLLSIAGWMFSYILTEKKNFKYLPIVIVLFLGFMSGSRAAFFAIIIQFIIASIIFLKNKNLTRNLYRLIIGFSTVSILTITYFSEPIYNYIKKEINSFKLDDSTHSLSNKSRFGIQQAMFYVFLENPILGTGYGLQAFESRKKYPTWAKKNNWEFRLKYLNQNDKRFPPGYNMYLRILSETGLVGLLFFGLMLLQVFLWCFNNLKSENSIIAFIILISMIGFSLNWLKMDSFRIYFFWLCLALIWVVEQRKISQNG
jgi:O-antigen ligase